MWLAKLAFLAIDFYLLYGLVVSCLAVGQYQQQMADIQALQEHFQQNVANGWIFSDGVGN